MSSSTAPPASRRWLGLAVIAAAQFMVIMDTSIIGVALPEIQADLGFSQENLSWVFNAYVIALGGLLLLGGKLSDLFGARRIFTVGWVVLIAGSAVAGAAGTVGAELVGRALQGAGSALIAPSALTLLMMLFGSNPRELTRALAFYGAAAPAGGTAPPGPPGWGPPSAAPRLPPPPGSRQSPPLPRWRSRRGAGPARGCGSRPPAPFRGSG